MPSALDTPPWHLILISWQKYNPWAAVLSASELNCWICPHLSEVQRYSSMITAPLKWPSFSQAAIPAAKAQLCTCTPEGEVVWRPLDIWPAESPSKELQNAIIIPGAFLLFTPVQQMVQRIWHTWTEFTLQKWQAANISLCHVFGKESGADTKHLQIFEAEVFSSFFFCIFKVTVLLSGSCKPVFPWLV